MSEINPRIEDGELVCDAACPSYECGGMMDRCEARKVRASHGLVSVVTDDGEPCVPGLRRQRDEAIDAAVRQASDLGRQLGEAKARGDTLERERDDARREVCAQYAGAHSRVRAVLLNSSWHYFENVRERYAASRGWSYLYADARDGGRNGNSD